VKDAKPDEALACQRKPDEQQKEGWICVDHSLLPEAERRISRSDRIGEEGSTSHPFSGSNGAGSQGHSAQAV
jgi:hypothetical protein